MVLKVIFFSQSCYGISYKVQCFVACDFDILSRIIANMFYRLNAKTFYLKRLVCQQGRCLQIFFTVVGHLFYS